MEVRQGHVNFVSKLSACVLHAPIITKCACSGCVHRDEECCSGCSLHDCCTVPLQHALCKCQGAIFWHDGVG
eukprot:1775373-Amphidinium_carterae.2